MFSKFLILWAEGNSPCKAADPLVKPNNASLYFRKLTQRKSEDYKTKHCSNCFLDQGRGHTGKAVSTKECEVWMIPVRNVYHTLFVHGRTHRQTEFRSLLNVSVTRMEMRSLPVSFLEIVHYLKCISIVLGIYLQCEWAFYSYGWLI